MTFEIDELKNLQIIEKNGKPMDVISVGAGKNSEVLKALGDGIYTIKHKVDNNRNLIKKRYKVLNGVILKLNTPKKKEIIVMDNQLTSMPQNDTRSELLGQIEAVTKPLYALVDKIDDQRQREVLEAIKAIKNGDKESFMGNFKAYRDLINDIRDEIRNERVRQMEEDDEDYDEDYYEERQSNLGKFDKLIDIGMMFLPKIFDFFTQKPKREKISNRELRGQSKPEMHDLTYVQKLQQENEELKRKLNEQAN